MSNCLFSLSPCFSIEGWGQDMSKTWVRHGRIALWSRPPNNSSSSKCSVPISSFWRKKRTISKWPCSTANRIGVIPSLLIMWLAPLSTRSRTVFKSPAKPAGLKIQILWQTVELLSYRQLLEALGSYGGSQRPAVLMWTKESREQGWSKRDNWHRAELNHDWKNLSNLTK